MGKTSKAATIERKVKARAPRENMFAMVCDRGCEAVLCFVAAEAVLTIAAE